MHLLKMVVACACGGFAVLSQAMADANVFVLKRTDSGFSLERMRIPEGTEVSWTLGKDGFVDVILPPGPGGSAGIVQSATSPTTVASCKDGKLSVTTTAMGKHFARPTPSPSELAALDIHVSARGADGATFGGFIRGYGSVEADPVSVIEDPFGDAIPLQKNDCVVYTSTFPSRSSNAGKVHGAFPVRYAAGHHLAQATIEGGGKGETVIDLAAGMTVIAKSALPKDAEIRPSEMMQHSAEGVKRLAAEVGGATGAATPLGIATLKSLALGDLLFSNVDVLVMDELPPVAEGIIGIVGLDLLDRAETISIPYPKSSETGELRLSAASGERPLATLPLAILDSRAYCRAKVNEADVCMIVDTGSPITIVEERVSKNAGLNPAAEDKDVRGIGSARSKLAKAEGVTLSLGEATLKDQVVMVGSLPLFSRFKGPTPIGILGNQTLAGFARVEMDFGKGELRVYAR